MCQQASSQEQRKQDDTVFAPAATQSYSQQPSLQLSQPEQQQSPQQSSLQQQQQVSTNSNDYDTNNVGHYYYWDLPLCAIEYPDLNIILTKDSSCWKSSVQKVLSIVLQKFNDNINDNANDNSNDNEHNTNSYRTAILHLQDTTTTTTSSSSGCKKIHANSIMMQELCCSLQITEILNNTTLQTYLVEFLHGLLVDKIVLRWTITIKTMVLDQESNNNNNNSGCGDDGMNDCYRLEKITWFNFM